MQLLYSISGSLTQESESKAELSVNKNVLAILTHI